MELTGWRVAHFGHLHDVAVDGLGPGLNVVPAPNEWGKTTTLHFLAATIGGYPPPQHQLVRRYRSAPAIGGEVMVIHEGAEAIVQRHLGSAPRLLAHDGSPLHHPGLEALLAGTTREHTAAVQVITDDDLDGVDLHDPHRRAHLAAAVTAGAGPGAGRAVGRLRAVHLGLLGARTGTLRDLAERLERTDAELASALAAEGRCSELRAEAMARRGEAESVSRRISELERAHDSLTEAPRHRTTRRTDRSSRADRRAVFAGVLAALVVLAVASLAARTVGAAAITVAVTVAVILGCAAVGVAVAAALGTRVRRTSVRSTRPTEASPLPGLSLAGLDAELDRLVAARVELLERAGAAFHEAERLAGEDRVSGLRDRRAGEEAELRSTVRRWAAARLAEAALLGALEDSVEHLDPEVLRLGSRWFASATAGRWRSIELAGGRPSVVHGAPGTAPVGIDRLSCGATEQLVVCLRLAVAAAAPPHRRLPLLVDDPLVHADASRAAAMAEVLGECARHTQVVVFTAHDHIAEVLVVRGGARRVTVRRSRTDSVASRSHR